MQLHPTGTNPTTTALLVCRNARWNLLIVLAVFWAAPVLWWFLDAPSWVLAMTAAVALLITWPMLSSWRKRGRADNWVLAVASDGLWLNLRDCEYHEAESGDTVVFIPYRKLSAARRAVHRYTTPSDDGGSTHHRDVYLELCLKQLDDGKLRGAIRQELQRPLPERRYLGGIVTTFGRRNQSAIEMRGTDCVRIKFSASNYGLRPSLKSVLMKLRRYVHVDDDFHEQGPAWQDLDDAALDDLVRRLSAGGQRMEARELLQKRRGLSLTEAKRIVDKIIEDTCASA